MCKIQIFQYGNEVYGDCNLKKDISNALSQLVINHSWNIKLQQCTEWVANIYLFYCSFISWSCKVETFCLYVYFALLWREQQACQDAYWVVKDEKVISQSDQPHLPPYYFGKITWSDWSVLCNKHMHIYYMSWVHWNKYTYSITYTHTHTTHILFYHTHTHTHTHTCTHTHTHTHTCTNTHFFLLHTHMHAHTSIHTHTHTHTTT